MRIKNNIVERVKIDTLDVSIIDLGTRKEYYISVLPGKEAEKELEKYLKDCSIKVLLSFVFGESLSENLSAPVSLLAHDNGKKYPLSGLQVFGVSGTLVKELRAGKELLGYSYEDKDARYAILGDIKPDNIKAKPEVQTREVYEKAILGLKEAGMDFTNVARTWFYLDKLLKWYGGFNEARTKVFKENDIFMKLVPSSTGIGARNTAGSALTASFFAVKPKNSSVTVEKVSSPLQCEAFNYKSAFSRAVELKEGDTRRLIISGTASIFQDGKSAYVGDLKKQIELTMNVVKEILNTRKMDWEDITRSILYFKDPGQEHIFKEYCQNHNIPAFPAISACTTVCRDELLFEIELDAVIRE